VTLHHANRGGILTEDTEGLLNQIARGETREVFQRPKALQALMDFRLVVQRAERNLPEEPSTFQVTAVGWKYVTCTRALALHKLQDPTPMVPMGDSRLGMPPGGRFARHLFGGMTDAVVNHVIDPKKE
jgi:hypothetical protein